MQQLLLAMYEQVPLEYIPLPDLRSRSLLGRTDFPISCVRLFANALSDMGVHCQETKKPSHTQRQCTTRADRVYANRPNTDMENPSVQAGSGSLNRPPHQNLKPIINPRNLKPSIHHPKSNTSAPLRIIVH